MVGQSSEGAHAGTIVLDIGDNVGALVIYTAEELRGKEIEISPLGNPGYRIHTGVLERRANGRVLFAGVFPAVPAGTYMIWRTDQISSEVAVVGGAVVEVDFRAYPSALAIRDAEPHLHRFGRALSPDMLPPRYRNGCVVSASPMGAAPLRYTEDGQVAWNEMWTDFCDLAMAGGPPHRDSVLESPSADEVQRDPDGYTRVLDEIERGFRLVTGLPTVRCAQLGWVGLICDDEGMASWLMLAIEVENVRVRREGTVLYLPVGPNFRLEKEIKNVVTVVAKTHHYWMEHRYS